MRRILIAGLLALCVPAAALPLAAQAGAYDDFSKLTNAEKWLVLTHFWQVGRVRDAAEFARTKSASTYPTLSGLDDQRDAHRHSTWNGCMTASLDSRPAAKRWGDAHEDMPNNPASRKSMDLANNATGRDIAWANRSVSGPWWNRKVTFPSKDGIAASMQAAVDAGRLQMIEEVGGQRDPHAGRLVPTTRP